MNEIVKAILKQCRENEVQLGLDGDNLQLHFDQAPADDLLQSIKQHKADIVAFLQQALVSNRASEQSSGESVDLTQLTIKTSQPDQSQTVPLSPQQHSLYFAGQLQQDASSYNMTRAFAYQGKLNQQAMLDTLTTIFTRHKLLTVAIHSQEGVANQKPTAINDEYIKAAIKSHDLSVLVASEDNLTKQQQSMKLWADEQAYRFTFDGSPLLRVTQIKHSENSGILIFNVHHVVADGVSIEILINEYSHYYNQYCQHSNNDAIVHLNRLDISYFDYVKWQQSDEVSTQLKAQQHYWQHKLQDLPPVHQLPLDFPRPGVKAGVGESYEFAIDGQLMAQVDNFCKGAGVSRFIFLQSVFAALVGRYSNHDDVVIGTPVAGRDHPQLANLIGLFINLVPLRSHVDASKSFSEFLQHSKQQVIGALAHQHLPFEQIVETLKPERTLAYNSVVQLLFSIEQQPLQRICLSELELQPLQKSEVRAKFDLELMVKCIIADDQSERWQSHWSYDPALFKPETIAQLAEHYVLFIEQVLAQSDVPLGQVNLLSHAEINAQVDKQVNRQQVNGQQVSQQPQNPLSEQLIHQQFEYFVDNTPDAVAIVCNNISYTYGQIEQQANKIANFLLAQGVKPNALVGLAIGRSVEVIVAMLGILKAGAGYLPLDLTLPQNRLAFVIDDGAIAIVLGSDSALSNCQLPCQTFDINAILNDQSIHSARANVAIDANHLAYVIYTSGSTGLPKGVMVEHRNVTGLLAGCYGKFTLSEQDRFSAFHSSAFDFSVWEIFAPLLIGAQVHIVPVELTQDMSALANWLVEQQITVLSQTPSVFYPLSAELIAVDKKSNLQYVVFGGEALEPSRLATWFDSVHSANVKLINMYGITETTVHVTYHQVTNSEASKCIGEPLPGYQAYVVNQQNQLQPNGVIGELCVAGAGVTRGYLNRDELTGERFNQLTFANGQTQRVYRTGDAISRSADGKLYYCGRIDQQIKIRGFRIEPGEIERQLEKIDAIAQAIVTKVELQSGAQLVAFVLGTTLPTSANIDSNDISYQLSQMLPAYMVPSAIVPLDKIPVTVNGKANTAKLIADYLAQHSTGEKPQGLALNGDTQRALAQIWCQLLGLDSVYANDDFFALGGHSLLVAKLLAMINSQWQLDLSLTQVFSHGLLADCADLIDTSVKQVNNTSGQSEYQSIAKPLSGEQASGASTNQVSLAQKRIWLACQLDGQNSKYNIPITIELTGQINQQAMAVAINEIVNRHQVLRSNFIANDEGNLSLKVQTETQVTLKLHDFSLLSATQADEQLAQLKRQQALQDFDLAAQLLLRGELVTMDDKRSVLMLTVHHIAFDGWSIDLLLEQFATVYNRVCRGVDNYQLAPLDIQYSDFAHWQQHQQQSEQQQQDLAYWQEKLAEAAPIHSLPLDKPRPELLTNQAGVSLAMLSNSQYANIERLATAQHVSVFNVVQSAFALFIGTVSADADVVMACPLASREHAQLQELIGLFVNNLVLRQQLTGQMNFAQMLASAKQELIAGIGHQSMPFDQLVSELNIARQPNYAPLCQLVLNYIHHPVAEIKLDNLQWQNISDEYQIADLDLHLTIRPVLGENGQQQLSVRWLYAQDLFTNDTITKWQDKFSQIIDWVCQNPDTAFAKMQLPTTNPQLKPEIEPELQPLHVHQLIEQIAASKPDAMAVGFQNEDAWQALSFGQLNQQANQLAHFLRSKFSAQSSAQSPIEIASQERIGICVSRSNNFVVAMLAVLKAGASYVPLEPENPEEVLGYIASDAKCNFIITEQGQLQRFEFISQYTMILVDEQFRQLLYSKMPEQNLDVDIAQSDTAYNIYTSGTTGKPKGVGVKHSALNNICATERDLFAFGDNARAIHAFSFGFDPATGHLFSALSAGAGVYICPLREDVAEFVEQHQLTHASLPTALAATFTPKPYDHLKLISVGGESCPRELASQWGQYCRFINLYGPTEATVYALYDEFQQGQDICIGQAVNNSQAYVINALDQVIASTNKDTSIEGELVICGASVATGYINQPNHTSYFSLALPDGSQARAYRTGDLVRLDASGKFHYLGRKDSQLKIRGYRIEPGQIQSQLLAIDGIDSAFITTFTNKTGTVSLVAYYSLKDPLNPSISVKQIKQQLGLTLPDYCVPTLYQQVEAFELTINGKVDTSALPAIEAQECEYVAPVNDNEQQIQQLWAQVLQLEPEQVSMQADFFELGGNSLLAMALVNETKQRFAIDVEVKDIFAAKNAQGLTEFLKSRGCFNGQGDSHEQASDEVEMEW